MLYICINVVAYFCRFYMSINLPYNQNLIHWQQIYVTFHINTNNICLPWLMSNWKSNF